MSDPEPQGDIAIPIVWVGNEDVPIYAVNNFTAQYTERDEFLLTLGQITPPLLLGSDEEKRAQAEKISYVGVTAVARIGLNRHRVKQLIEVLQQNLANHDHAFGGDQQ